MTPEQTINQANYIEWLKLIQKCYLLAYVSGFIILSHILTLSGADLDSMITIPLISVPVPRIIAVLFTLFLFWGLGVTVLVANRKLKKIGSKLPAEIALALRNYPSVTNGSAVFRTALFFGLFLIFLLIFYLGNKSSFNLDVLINSAVSTSPFFLAIFVGASNKTMHRTAEAASD